MAETVNTSRRVLDLFEQRFSGLFREARRYMPPSDAESICQDLFAELVDRATEYDLDQLESNDSLLPRLLRDRVARQLRPLIRLHRAVVEDEADALRRPTPAGLRKLGKSIHQLSRDERLAVRLAICEGVSREGVSRQLGVTQQLLEVWINRGIHQLRQHACA